jgi:hypothetical protein
MNQRQYERLDVDITEISGDIMFANEVTILNISLGGISLRADRRLNVGKEYTVKMKVKDNFISVKGKVVWSLLSESRNDSNGDFVPIYTVGIQFVHGSDEKIEEIIEFIKKHRRGNENNDDCDRSSDFMAMSYPDKETLQPSANH